MNKYIINTQLGFVLVEAETAKKALINYWTEEITLDNLFLDREDLEKKGYKNLTSTNQDKIYKIK